MVILSISTWMRLSFSSSGLVSVSLCVGNVRTNTVVLSYVCGDGAASYPLAPLCGELTLWHS